MKAMLLNQLCSLDNTSRPLVLADLPDPIPGRREVLLKVSACGVCHTELDEIEGRTPPTRLPVVLGHQAVGEIVQTGTEVADLAVGDRVGVAWIYRACGKCRYCLAGTENLCAEFRATGRDVNGGYAEYLVVREDFAHRIPPAFADVQAAPLLCAGAVGYRSLKLSDIEDGQNLGFTGFGASAHLVLTLAKHLYPNLNVFVFARSESERSFARELGAVWAGDTEASAPAQLDGIIDTTPVWKPVVEALKNLAPGGRLVINAIRKEDVDRNYLLRLDYAKHLWLEKEIKSVANVARSDVREFLQLAAEIPIKPEVQEFALPDANAALLELKQSKIRGAKVLKID
jgi:propanol-preferring alcohol dehydrogenase